MKTLNEIVQKHYGDVCPSEKLFRSHLEFANKRFPTDISRLVIQMESVHKLKGQQFDLVILDESEAALTQFSAPTMTNLRSCAGEFFRICREASKFIVCDGFMTKRTTNFIQHVLDGTDKKCLVHVNEHLVTDKVAFQLSSVKELIGALIKVVENGQRPAMFTASKRQGDEVVKAIKKHFNDKIRVQSYNADADDEKMLDDLGNVDQAWTRIDFVMYSPVITNGVNFTAEHFDCMFLLGCCVSQVMQAARRIRKLSQKRMYFYLNSRCFLPGKLPWKYEVVEEDMHRNQEVIREYFELERRHLMTAKDMQSDLISGFVEKSQQEAWTSEETLRRLNDLKDIWKRLDKCQIIPPWLWDVLVRNRIEVNLSRSMYEELFKDYLKRIGVADVYQYDAESHVIKNRSNTVFVGENGTQEQTVLSYNDIRIISMEEADRHMEKQRCKKATYVQKRELKRWFFDKYMVLNSQAPSEARRAVFNAIEQDKKKGIMFDLMLKEHSETAASLIEKMEIGGNPFLPTYPPHISIIPAMQKLCKILGLKSSLDFDSVFTSDQLVQLSGSLYPVLKEMYDSLGIRDQAKHNNSRGECSAEFLRGRLSAIFKAWSKSKISSESQRDRKGSSRGKRLYTFRLSNTDPFGIAAKSLLQSDGA